jgi:AcrR family transcriptional regulator
MVVVVTPDTDARGRLVAAAQQLFADQGVGATSPRQVLSASGVGQGSLYHHFPTKHDLAVAAVGATVEQALTAAQRELASDAPAVRRGVGYHARPRPCRVRGQGRLVVGTVAAVAQGRA